MQYVSSKQAQQFYNVSDQTLRRWANDEKIQFKLTKGKHRRYQICDQNDKRLRIIYARVSSQKQKADLQRQIKFLQQKFPQYRVIKDVSSGLNFERKGLQTILDEVLQSNVAEVVVYSKDRLCRFGFPLFEYIFGKFHTKLTIVSDKKKTENEELVEDMLAITTVFSAKIHGRRKYNIQ